MNGQISRLLSGGLLVGLLFASSIAQIQQPLRSDEQKPKRPKFGSSLKALKWDPATEAAVETRQDKKRPGESGKDTAIKLDTLFVALDVLAVTRETQQLVTGLQKDDFVVTEDEQPQQVATFAMGDDTGRPRSIILIIDYSGSQAPYLKTSLEAAKTLVGKLAPQDEMAIVTDDVELLIDFTRDRAKLTAVLDKLRKRVFEKQDQGRSFQFTALFAALRELTGNKTTRPVIIFQTDGDEAPAFKDQPQADRFAFLRGEMPSQAFGLSDIFRAAQESPATVYSVVTSDRLIGIPESELVERGAQMMAKRHPLKPGEDANPAERSLTRLFIELFRQGQLATVRVATLTGGWTAWLERPEQADRIYSQILSDINNRYIIGYYPTNTTRDGKVRNVRIELKGHPEYQVHGRTSYIAPER